MGVDTVKAALIVWQPLCVMSSLYSFCWMDKQHCDSNYITSAWRLGGFSLCLLVAELLHVCWDTDARPQFKRVAARSIISYVIGVGILWTVMRAGSSVALDEVLNASCVNRTPEMNTNTS